MLLFYYDIKTVQKPTDGTSGIFLGTKCTYNTEIVKNCVFLYSKYTLQIKSTTD